MAKLGTTAFLALLLGSTACAHAPEPLLLSCRFGDYQETRTYPDRHVETDPREPRSAEMFLSLDLAAATITMGDTTGAFEESDGVIAMATETDLARSTMFLNRSNGSFRSTTVTRGPEYTRTETWFGQCEPESGTPF